MGISRLPGVIRNGDGSAMEPKPRTVTMVYGGYASALTGVGLNEEARIIDWLITSL